MGNARPSSTNRSDRDPHEATTGSTSCLPPSHTLAAGFPPHTLTSSPQCSPSVVTPVDAWTTSHRIGMLGGALRVSRAHIHHIACSPTLTALTGPHSLGAATYDIQHFHGEEWQHSRYMAASNKTGICPEPSARNELLGIEPRSKDTNHAS
jgi:hypothetical protein